jgi:hypothetical protein
MTIPHAQFEHVVERGFVKINNMTETNQLTLPYVGQVSF